MKKPKKETRDVIAKHVRWTEALRVVRAYHPEVTIILPEEKIQILPRNGSLVIFPVHIPSLNTSDRKSTRLNSSHANESRMPSSA